MTELPKALKELLKDPFLTNFSSSLGGDADLHLVGGTVRDGFLGETPIDLDCATSLNPNEITKRLAEHFRVIPTGIEHGTVRVLVPDSKFHSIEITTFRKASSRTSSEYSKTIEEDLAGRDYTINSIAVSFNSKKIIDPFLGLKDLENKLLKAVGDPEARIKEDPLRILRAVRFGPAQGRAVEANTQKSCSDHSTELKNVSIERIRDELEKILLSQFPAEGIKAFRDWGLLPFTIPEFLESVGFEQNEFHHEDVFNHTLTVLSKSAQDKLVRFAALFHDIGKPRSLTVDERGRHFYNHENIGAQMTKEILERMRFSHQDAEKVSLLVEYHMRPLECGPAGVRRLFRALGEDFEKWRELKIADSPPADTEEQFRLRLDAFDAMVKTERDRIAKSQTGEKLAVSGDDIIRCGVKSGPNVGNVLKFLEEKVIEQPELNQKDVLLNLANEYIQGNRLC